MSAGATRAQRAERLRALHHAPEVLLLPNVWDPLGARLLEGLGYPAVATASAAVAWSLGREDGEFIDYAIMLEAIRRIADAVSVPVTADIERGYATTHSGLRSNIEALIAAGAVGLNLEDSLVEGGALRPVDEQCERLRVVRATATAAGVPLVINARTDVYLVDDERTPESRLAEATSRGRAYLDAGADCIYPIGLSELSSLVALREALDAPINVFGSAAAPSVAQLRQAGIARLSLGPTLLKASLATLRSIAEPLLDGTYDLPAHLEDPTPLLKGSD